VKNIPKYYKYQYCGFSLKQESFYSPYDLMYLKEEHKLKDFRQHVLGKPDNHINKNGIGRLSFFSSEC